MLNMSVVQCNDTMMQYVEGHVQGFLGVRLYTNVNAVGLAGGTNDLWKVVASPAITVRTNPAAAIELAISSSNGGDTTQSVTVNGLDVNYEPISVTKKLAGQTKTVLSTVVYFFRVLSVTLDVACAGNVFVYDASVTVVAGIPQTATKVQAEITIADLQDYNLQTTIPAGKQGWLYIVSYITSASSTKDFKLRAVFTDVNGVVTYQNLAHFVGDPITGAMQFTNHPLLISEKSDFKIEAILEGGASAVQIECWAEIILEDIVPTENLVNVLTKSEYDAYLTANSRTLASTKLYLIGLDGVLTEFPTQVDVGNVLAVITGTTLYKVAATTEIAFDISQYKSGLYIPTTFPSIACVWRCVDSAAFVKYVSGLSPQMIILGPKTMKTTFTA